MNAPVLANEKKRLKVLWQYEVLDTLPEAVFDDLTELAAQICEAPTAMISLVDEDRQWFKSKVGTNLSETPRNISFCGHAIHHSGLFIVPDATLDPRFKDNPLVLKEPKIRFYAGAPLLTPDGYALGTLCVLDKVPRLLKPDQQDALRILARHVVSLLELRRHSRQLVDVKQENEGYKRELQTLRERLAKTKPAVDKIKPNAAATRKPGKPRSR